MYIPSSFWGGGSWLYYLATAAEPLAPVHANYFDAVMHTVFMLDKYTSLYHYAEEEGGGGSQARQHTPPAPALLLLLYSVYL